MKLDVKNLAFGAVGETDTFDLSLAQYKVADDLIANSLKGKIKLTRLDDSILTQFSGEADIYLACDRCLEEFVFIQDLEFSREYFLGGFRENEEDLLVSKRFEIDISQPIREELIVALPTQVVCQKKCKGICPGCGKDLNLEKCNCSKTDKKKL